MESEGSGSSRKDAASVCSERSSSLAGGGGVRKGPLANAMRVNRLQSGGRPPRLFLQQTLCCLHMDACNSCGMKRATSWIAPPQGRTDSFEVFRPSPSVGGATFGTRFTC